MRVKRALKVGFLFIVLLSLPALIAPHVSDDPIAWAYRVYHPFMYRYPNYFASVVLNPNATSDLRMKSRVDQSIEVLALMIRHW